mgnify:CR=1 FL=1
MRDKFDQILKDHSIYGEDVEEILYAVSDMLELVAEETKENEPYTTNSIERLETAAHEVWNLAIDL